ILDEVPPFELKPSALNQPPFIERRRCALPELVWEKNLMSSNRRKFIKDIAKVSGAAALSTLPGVNAIGRELDHLSSQSLPTPSNSGIDHIVVVMMENRSFDHLFGWIRGAKGKQAGLVFKDADGIPHATHHLAPDFTGCGHPDPDHSYTGGRI